MSLPRVVRECRNGFENRPKGDGLGGAHGLQSAAGRPLAAVVAAPLTKFEDDCI